MSIDDIVDGAFSTDNMEMYRALAENNIEKLKKLGEVHEQKKLVNGIISKEITFIAPDGRRFLLYTNEFATNVLHKQVAELNARIDKAVAEEDYRAAAQLKKQKDELLKNN
jgi:hypothetical protein